MATTIKASEYSKIFWLEALKLSEQQQNFYHLFFTYHYKNGIDIKRLKTALQTVINTNYNCRSNFILQDGELYQAIHDVLDANLQSYMANSKDDHDSILKQLLNKPFDLAEDPLFRLAVIHNNYNSTITLFLVFHHIILDGTQLKRLMETINNYYRYPPDHNITDKDEINRLKKYLKWEQTKIKKSNPSHLVSLLKDYPSNNKLPYKHVVIDKTKLGSTSKLYTLDQALYKKLASFSKRHGFTIFNIMKTAFALLISQYCNQEKVVVSYPFNTRGQFKDIKGAFVNTLFYAFERKGCFIEKLASLKKDESVKQRYASTANILTELKKHGEMFNVAISQSNIGLHGPNLNGLPSYSTSICLGGTELSFFYDDNGTGLDYILCTLDEIFDSNFQDSFSRHFNNILHQVIDNPLLDLRKISCLDKSEYTRQVFQWNDTKKSYSKNKCIHQLFEEQAENEPNKTAVIFDNQKLTYGELNNKAAQLAQYLQKLGVKPETLVAICIERSFEMLIGLLGILKAGGAYVPLDPNYPKERLQFILEDTKAPVLLTYKNAIEHLDYLGEIVKLDHDWQKIAKYPNKILTPNIKSDSLAYVVYTSGSTGQPKGVCICHRGVIRLVKQAKYVTITKDDSFLQHSSLSFDAATFEIWGSLLNGSRLCLAPPHILTLAELATTITKNAISILWLTAGVFHQMVNEQLNSLLLVKQLLAGGDVLSIIDVKKLLQNLPKGHQLINAYGPTENTTLTCCYTMPSTDVLDQHVPIGKPINNTQVYVLDNYHIPVPIGVTGELYVAGDGLARDYLNQPQLTQEKFIRNPFNTDPDSRLYKTGDLARYLPGGNLEFLGRIDNQVKIRGFRVELGEIEANLIKYKAIKAAAVTVDEESGEKRLAAYVVTDNHVPEITELRAFLKSKLPDYMLPNLFFQLEKLPLTISGKIDRNALPTLNKNNLAKKKYLAPSTPTEKVTAKIWSDVLKIDNIGVKDDFFVLGGHSLLATQIISRIESMFPVKINIRNMLENPTIQEFAQFIESSKRQLVINSQPNLIKTDHKKPQPLSFSQQRLWFLNKFYSNPIIYNTFAAWILEGALEVSILQKALLQIIKRQASLRTTFITLDGKAMQKLQPKEVTSFNLEVQELSSTSDAEIKRAIIKATHEPFKLNSGPLFRIKLFKLSSNQHVFFICMHHIISDGWSFNLFYKELSLLYRAYYYKQSNPLADLSIQYVDFSNWQQSVFNEDSLQKQRKYWQGQLKNLTPLELPIDNPRPPKQTYNGRFIAFTIPDRLTEKLKSISRENNATLFATLLSAFNILLARYSNQSDITVGTPIANRRYQSIEDIIGFFVNTLVIRSDLSNNTSFNSFLKQNKEVILDAVANRDMPFERVVEELRPIRDQSRSPLFQVMFAFDNTASVALDLPGCNAKKYSVDCKISRFELSCLLEDNNNTVSGGFEYNTELFNYSKIERMVKHFMAILNGIAENPNQPIHNIRALTPEEEKTILVDWNKTASSYPESKTLPQLFEEQVKKHPNETAIIFKEEELSFIALNQKANQLAHHLKKRTAQPDAYVAVYFERSLETIISLLAVLKAGFTYVPIDTSAPKLLIRQFITDCNADLIITTSELVTTCTRSLKFDEPKIVIIDREREIINHEPTANLTAFSPQKHAYILYTSGSSGKQKGVPIHHQALINFIYAMRSLVSFSKNDVLLAITPITFDISALEIYLPLCTGAHFIFADETTRLEPEQIKSLISKHNVTIMQATPATWQMLVNTGWDNKENIKLLSGGEGLTATLAAQLYRKTTKLWNLYGPTETTIWSTAHKVDRVDINKPLMPIGRPIANTQVYVLDKYLQPLPIGVAGKLYIGGDGVAHGYLNNTKLNKHRFINNIYNNCRYSKLYETGDIVQWLPNGELEFIRRIDSQVKIRGYRIETGAIETCMRKHENISECICIVSEQKYRGEKELLAYIIPKNYALPFTPTEMRNYLGQYLPNYMMPTKFIAIEEFPLTPNGKVDLNTLLSTEKTQTQLLDEVTTANGQSEEIISTILKTLLNLEQIDISSNFFDLGAHSLLLVEAAYQLSKKMNRHISVTELFTYPSVQSLAAHLSQTISTNLDGFISESERAAKRKGRNRGVKKHVKDSFEHI